MNESTKMYQDKRNTKLVEQLLKYDQMTQQTVLDLNYAIFWVIQRHLSKQTLRIKWLWLFIMRYLRSIFRKPTASTDQRLYDKSKVSFFLTRHHRELVTDHEKDLQITKGCNT